MLKKNKKWFTLMELIVIIAILAILAIWASWMLKTNDSREKVEIISSGIQSKIENIQFFAISGKWIKENSAPTEWKLPDKWFIRINPVASTRPWVSSTNANITSFYEIKWTSNIVEFEKIVEANRPILNPTTVDVKCIMSNWTEEILAADNSLDIVMKWIYIKSIEHTWNATEDSCIGNIKELHLSVWSEKSIFKSRIKISKPAWTIELLRWN